MMLGARTGAWAKSADQYNDIAFRVVIPDNMVGVTCMINSSGTSTKDSVGYVDWGDGYLEKHLNTSKSWSSYKYEHAYSAAGEYVVQSLPNQNWSIFTGEKSTVSSDIRNCIDAILNIDPSEVCSISHFAYGAPNLVTMPKVIGESGNLRDCKFAFSNCNSLDAKVPSFGDGVTNLERCFSGSSISGNLPDFPDSITSLEQAFYGCTGVYGNIPRWPSSCTSASLAYYHTSLTGTWIDWPGDFSLLTPAQIDELMPETITSHNKAVSWNSNDFRRFFYSSWGGMQPDPV